MFKGLRDEQENKEKSCYSSESFKLIYDDFKTNKL